MIERKSLIATVIILICIFFRLPSSGAGLFHERSDKAVCIKCHKSVPTEGSSPIAERNILFDGDVEKTCMVCHNKYQHEHPVKLVLSPSLKGSKSIPIGMKGKIICITCHDVMRKIPIHRNVELSGKELCLNCHVESDIFAQIIWYPTHLKKGETGRLEIKVVEFNSKSKKSYIGDTVLLYFYAKDVDEGNISFGTNVLHDDGTNGDRVRGDSIYTITEAVSVEGKGRRLVYTGWILDKKGKRSNTVNLAIEYED